MAAAGGSLEDHQDHRNPMELFQWFHGSSTLVTVMSSEPKVNRHESKRYKRPSATQRLIVADSLGNLGHIWDSCSFSLNSIGPKKTVS